MGISKRVKGSINQSGGSASHGQTQTGAKTLANGGGLMNAGKSGGKGKMC